MGRISLPILETKRLILREIEEKDVYDMFAYASLPIVGPVAGWEPHTSLSYTKSVIKMFRNKYQFGQIGVFAVVLKENMKMIGTIELHTYTKNHKAELGYTISPYYWGNGYAYEASKVVVSWGFNELDLKRIECSCYVDNKQSNRVCEKLGLEYEGIRKKGYMLYDGTIHDIKCYSIIDDDYYERVKKLDW